PARRLADRRGAAGDHRRPDGCALPPPRRSGGADRGHHGGHHPALGPDRVPALGGQLRGLVLDRRDPACGPGDLGAGGDDLLPAAPAGPLRPPRSAVMSTPPQSPLAQDTRSRPQYFADDVRRLRRVLLIFFVRLALPILLLTLLATNYMSLPMHQANQQLAYENGNYNGAIERLAPLQLAIWFQQY